MPAQQSQQIPIRPQVLRSAAVRSSGAPSRLGSLARQVRGATSERDALVAAHQREQDGHPHLAAADAGLRAVIVFFWIFAVLAYSVDRWLTSPYIDEQITMYLSDLQPWAKTMFLWLSPAVFVVLDITSGLQRHHATETGRNATGWTLVCIALIVASGTAVVALQLTQPDWDLALAVKTGFLATLVMLVHGVLAFHQQGPEAITYPFYAITASSLNARRRDVQSSHDQLTREFSDTYRAYLDDLRTTEPGAGPVRRPELDVLTEEVIAEIFGRPAATEAAAPQAQRPAPTPGPIGNAAGNAGAQESVDGENAYLRSVLDRRVRDADSEVTV